MMVLGIVWLSTVWMVADAAATVAPPTLDGQRIGWQALTFRASKLGLTATSTVRLTRRPRADAEAALLTVDDPSLLRPTGPTTMLVELETLLRNRRSVIDAFFDPTTGHAFQRGKLETGRKHYQRTDRLASNAVHRRRRAPASDAEIDAGAAGWTDREAERVTLPTVPADATVTVPAALFYVIGSAPLDTVGDRMRLHAFSRQSIDLLEVEVIGRAAIAVDHALERDGRTTRRQATIDALCIAVRAEPMGTDDSDASFRFLGLKGDVEIYLDPETRLPLQVSGSTGFLGRLDVKLEHATLVASAR